MLIMLLVAKINLLIIYLEVIIALKYLVEFMRHKLLALRENIYKMMLYNLVDCQRHHLKWCYSHYLLSLSRKKHTHIPIHFAMGR